MRATCQFPRPSIASPLFARSARSLAIFLAASTPILAEAVDQIAAGAEGDGRIEVFFAADDNGTRLLHSWQLARKSEDPATLGIWAQWEDIVRHPDRPAGITLVPDGQSRLAVGMLVNGTIWSAHQEVPGGAFATGTLLDTHDLKADRLCNQRGRSHRVSDAVQPRGSVDHLPDGAKCMDVGQQVARRYATEDARGEPVSRWPHWGGRDWGRWTGLLHVANGTGRGLGSVVDDRRNRSESRIPGCP